MLLFVASSLMVVYFNEKRNEAKKAIAIYHEIENRIALANSLGYFEFEDKEEKAVLHKEGKNLLLDDDMIKTFASGNIVMLIYNQHYYFHFKDLQLYFKSSYTTSSLLVYAGLFLLIGSFLIYMLLTYIRKSIAPLRELHQKIEAFGKGDFNIDTRLKQHDEVANVGNAFYTALESIKQLEANRALFIRNISHELKTPLTKSTLIVHGLQELDTKSKKDLLENNKQMNRVIDTISQFDSLQSRHLQLDLRIVNLIDVLEEAIDESEIEDELISLKVEQTSRQELDFDRMVLAIKNLLRNAYLHSGKQKIHVTLLEKSLVIMNESLSGKALDFEKVTQAFYKDSETSQGMGLGTYIAKSIVELHGFELSYKYDENVKRHSFSILFEN